MFGVGIRGLTIMAAGVLSMAASAQPRDTHTLADLEKQLKEIDGRLAQLATYSLGSGVGAIGYRSSAHEDADHAEWIEVDFGQPVPLDEVVLVPAIRRDGSFGFQADGFPEAFRLVAGTGEDRIGKTVARFETGDRLLPRIAPVVIPCGGVTASWIRVEAQILSLRAFDRLYVFQLSEILAFSGQEDVALHKPVQVSAGDTASTSPGWAAAYVVDGLLPYLMASPRGKGSVAYVSPTNTIDRPALMIDLGERHPISRIHLHAVDQSDTVPQAYLGDFGVPKVLQIDGASAPDLSDAKRLIELRHDTLYDVGPIMLWTFPETECRYVRLQVIEPSASPLYVQNPDRLGFAEIEVFSRGRNVALHKPVTANFTTDNPLRLLSALTDGANFYGEILPSRDWLNQLATRHELERERPWVVADLGLHYARQKANLKRFFWLTVLLAAAVVVVILVDRFMRQRAIERTRLRIAADLHDELGADLHALGLLTDLAQAARAAPEKLAELLPRMRALTERTGKAARHCTNMLEAQGLFGDPADDMRRTAERLLADLEHDLRFEGEEALRTLSPRRRIDLLLFYQECLANIIRHSGATRVHTRLQAGGGTVELTVDDNGQGLRGGVPASLRRRARLLGAKVEAGRSPSRGARIHLRLKIRRMEAAP